MADRLMYYSKQISPDKFKVLSRNSKVLTPSDFIRLEAGVVSLHEIFSRCFPDYQKPQLSTNDNSGDENNASHCSQSSAGDDYDDDGVSRYNILKMKAQPIPNIIPGVSDIRIVDAAGPSDDRHSKTVDSACIPKADANSSIRERHVCQSILCCPSVPIHLPLSDLPPLASVITPELNELIMPDKGFSGTTLIVRRDRETNSLNSKTGRVEHSKVSHFYPIVGDSYDASFSDPKFISKYKAKGKNLTCQDEVQWTIPSFNINFSDYGRAPGGMGSNVLSRPSLTNAIKGRRFTKGGFVIYAPPGCGKSSLRRHFPNIIYEAPYNSNPTKSDVEILIDHDWIFVTNRLYLTIEGRTLYFLPSQTRVFSDLILRHKFSYNDAIREIAIMIKMFSTITYIPLSSEQYLLGYFHQLQSAES